MEASKRTDKPDWLIRLEQESWQAELIISGVAVLGALQLPSLVSKLEYFLLDNLYRSEIDYWGFFAVFLRIGTVLLIGTFIVHFVLRALWIGMVGVNSVYPRGIVPNKMYNDEFNEQVIKEFGDVTGYIRRLDDRCSAIFGIGFSLCLLFWGYIFIMLVIGVTAHWSHSFLPDNFTILAGLVIYILIIAVAAMSMWMGAKANREKAFTKRWQYPLSKFFGKIFFNLAYRPVYTITYLLISRVEEPKKGNWLNLLIFMIACFVVGLLSARNNLLTEWRNHRYHRSGADSTLIDEFDYMSDAEDVYYFQPVLEQREVSYDGGLQVFVPLPQREREGLLEGCSIAVPSDEADADADAARLAERQRLLACAHEYIDVQIDGEPVTDYEMYRRYVEGRLRQYGVQIELFDLRRYRLGRHVIGITTRFLNEDGEPRRTYINFTITGTPQSATRDSL